jgi:hypothetical protein
MNRLFRQGVVESEEDVLAFVYHNNMTVIITGTAAQNAVDSDSLGSAARARCQRCTSCQLRARCSGGQDGLVSLVRLRSRG